MPQPVLPIVHLAQFGLPACALALGLAGAGRLPVRFLRTPAAHATVALLLGLMLAGTFNFGLALAGLFMPGVLAAALVLAGGAGLVAAPPRRPRFRAPASAPGRAAAALGAAVFTAYAVGALAAPETETDSYLYHLAAPWQVLQAHRFPLERIPVSFELPLPVELSTALLLAPGDDRAVKALACLAALATIAGWVALARARGVTVAVWLGLAVTWSSAVMGWMAFVGKSDVPAAALLVTGALLLRVPRGGPAGLSLLACAAAAKYTYGPAAVTLIALSGRPWRALAAGAGLMLAAMLPWMARTWLATGFPLPAIVFPGLHTALWTALHEQTYLNYYLPYRDPDTLRLAALPVTWARRLAADNPLLLPGLALLWSRPGFRRAGLGCAAAQLVTLAAAHLGRYMLPVTWLEGLLVAEAATMLGPRARRAALGVLLAGAVVQTARLGRDRPPGWRFLLRDRAAAWAGEYTGYAEAAGVLRDRGAPRTLAWGEMRSHRLPGRILAGGFNGETPLPWQAVHDAPDVRRVAVRFRQFGARLFLYNYVNGAFIAQYYRPWVWTDPMLTRYAAFVRAHLRPVHVSLAEDFRNGGFFVYEFSPVPARPLPRTTLHLPGAESAFLRSTMLRNGGDYPAAIAELAGLAARHPDVRFYVNEWATDLALRGDWAGVYRLLKPRVDEGWRDPTTLSDFGGGAITLRRPAEAHAPLREALARPGPGMPGLRVRLAQVCYEMAQPLAAQGRARDALPLLAEADAALAHATTGLTASQLEEHRQARAMVTGLTADLARLRGERAAALAGYRSALALGANLSGSNYWSARIRELSPTGAR